MTISYININYNIENEIKNNQPNHGNDLTTIHHRYCCESDDIIQDAYMEAYFFVFSRMIYTKYTISQQEYIYI